MADVAERAARSTADKRRVEEWALVLAAANIPYRLQEQLSGWVLLVGANDGARAAAALDAYERESADRQAARMEYGPTAAGLLIALALVAFFAVTSWTEGAWFRSGEAAAASLLAGEPWRAITALTLHVNLPHVVSNAVAFAVFGTAVCRALGPGVGLWLMLLAGAGGNVLNALLRGGAHRAVGASTAVFGAVGILGALQLMHRHRLGVGGRHAWVPVAAALGLLAMLGTAATTDVLAHLFGFLVGGALGVGVALAVPRPPARVPQLLLATGAVAVVVLAWVAALR